LYYNTVVLKQKSLWNCF